MKLISMIALLFALSHVPAYANDSEGAATETTEAKPDESESE